MQANLLGEIIQLGQRCQRSERARLRARPVCFGGPATGVRGAFCSVEQLQAIFGYRNAHIFPVRVFLLSSGKLLDEAGQFTSPDSDKRLHQQAAGFIGFVEKLRGRKLS